MTAPDEEERLRTGPEDGTERDRSPTVEEVIDAYEWELKSMKEGRHQLFFELAVKLRSQGKTLDDIELEVYRIAGRDPKMREKAKWIMESLRRYDRRR
jgi:hypothetical protein